MDKAFEQMLEDLRGNIYRRCPSCGKEQILVSACSFGHSRKPARDYWRHRRPVPAACKLKEKQNG